MFPKNQQALIHIFLLCSFISHSGNLFHPKYLWNRQKLSSSSCGLRRNNQTICCFSSSSLLEGVKTCNKLKLEQGIQICWSNLLLQFWGPHWKKDIDKEQNYSETENRYAMQGCKQSLGSIGQTITLLMDKQTRRNWQKMGKWFVLPCFLGICNRLGLGRHQFQCYEKHILLEEW